MDHHLILYGFCRLLLLLGIVYCCAACNGEDTKPPIDSQKMIKKDTLGYENTHIPDYNSPDNAFLVIQNLDLPRQETLLLFSQLLRESWNQNLIDAYLQKIAINEEQIQSILSQRYYLSPRIEQATDSVEHIKKSRLYLLYLMINGENLLRKGEYQRGLDCLNAGLRQTEMISSYPACTMEFLTSYVNLKSISDFLLHLKKNELLSKQDLTLLFVPQKMVQQMPVALYLALSGDQQAILSLIAEVQNGGLPEIKLDMALRGHYQGLYQDLQKVKPDHIDAVLSSELSELLKTCLQGKVYEVDLSAYPFLAPAEENVLQYFLTPYCHLFPQIQKIFHQVLIFRDSNIGTSDRTVTSDLFPKIFSGKK